MGSFGDLLRFLLASSEVWATRTGACGASTPSALMTTWRDGADISACVPRYRQGRLGMSAHARGPTA